MARRDKTIITVDTGRLVDARARFYHLLVSPVTRRSRSRPVPADGQPPAAEDPTTPLSNPALHTRPAA